MWWCDLKSKTVAFSWTHRALFTLQWNINYKHKTIPSALNYQENNKREFCKLLFYSMHDNIKNMKTFNPQGWYLMQLCAHTSIIPFRFISCSPAWAFHWWICIFLSSVVSLCIHLAIFISKSVILSELLQVGAWHYTAMIRLWVQFSSNARNDKMFTPKAL